MKKSVVLFLLFATVAALSGCGASHTSLDQGLEHYDRAELEEAMPYFERATEEKPLDADGFAWLAETQRRLGQRADARDNARMALALDDCHSFALLVMGDLYNPQYRTETSGGLDPEKAWDHYVKATECDPDDGNAWLQVWNGSLSRGDEEIEKRALTRLYEIDFFTPAALAHSRWLLDGAPENAVLLVNGDMDTYPLLALQQAEGYRADVVVVNYTLLNMLSYGDLLSQRYGIPIPTAPPRPYRGEDGDVVYISTQVVAYWLGEVEEGTFPRPLAVSVTVPARDFTPESERRFEMIGSCFVYRGEDMENEFDVEAMIRGLDAVDPGAFAGPLVSRQDRSAIRQAYSAGLTDNLVNVALFVAEQDLAADRPQAALDRVKWAKEFKKKAPGLHDFDQRFEDLEDQAKAMIEEEKNSAGESD